MAGPGADPWAFGRALQRERARDGLWVVVDEGDGPLAGLMTRLPAVGAPDPELPAIFPPMIELEHLEPDALFIHMLAALPQARARRSHPAHRGGSRPWARPAPAEPDRRR